MHAVLGAIIDVGSVGLPVLFLLIALETTGIPLPGETALIACAIAASQGALPIEGVIVVAATAAILGDNTGFLLGRRYGRRLLLAKGPLLEHRERAVALGEPFFAKHGPKAVFLGRFVSGLRITAAWLAGIEGMRWPVFTFYNALGGIVWATAFGLLAFYAGEHAGHVLTVIGGVAAGGVVVAIIAVVLVRRRRAAPGGPSAAPEPEPS